MGHQAFGYDSRLYCSSFTKPGPVPDIEHIPSVSKAVSEHDVTNNQNFTNTNIDIFRLLLRWTHFHFPRRKRCSSHCLVSVYNTSASVYGRFFKQLAFHHCNCQLHSNAYFQCFRISFFGIHSDIKLKHRFNVNLVLHLSLTLSALYSVRDLFITWSRTYL